MRMWKRSVLALIVAVACWIPASGWAQTGTDVTDATEETDTADEETDKDKNWTVGGSIVSRVGQGTFVGLENESGIQGEYQSNSTAYDRANLIYTLSPSYTIGEFNVGAEFSLVQWLTAGGGTSGIAAAGGANDPADVYFQDILLSGGWQGYTFDSIGLTLAPALEIGLPTSKSSQLNTKLFHVGTDLSIMKTFFERLTLQGAISFAKYFHRYESSAIDPADVGEDNVLFRPGEAEDFKSGLVGLGGYNLSHLLAVGGATEIKIWKKLSGSISYFMINYYSYPGNSKDEFTAENAKPGRNLSQAVSTSASLSYGIKDWLSVSGGIGTFMSPKTSDNESFRFPFWNTDGASANRSWLQLGVSGSY